MAEKKEETPDLDLGLNEGEEVADNWTSEDYSPEEPLLTESQIVDIRYRAPLFRDKFNNVDAEALKKSYPLLTKGMADYIDELAKNEFGDAPDANVNNF